MSHLIRDERSNTNAIMGGILGSATARRTDLEAKLAAQREKNLIREFEKFKASGKTLPASYIERVPGSGKRFSTTTKSAMEEIHTHRGSLPDRNKIIKEARDRKMFNWTPQHTFGDEKVVYETDARRKPAGDAESRMRESMAATRDGRERAKGMKEALTKTQWQLGEEENSMRDARATSVLLDPTGPSFSSYRGVLDPEVGRRIKTSTAFDGVGDKNLKSNYETTSQAGAREGVSEGVQGYKENKARAARLKKQLGGTTFKFGEGERETEGGEEKTRLTTDYRDGFKFSPELAKGAMRALDPELIANLRATHFTFAPEGGGWGDDEARKCTQSELNNRNFVEAKKHENRDLREEKEKNRRMKLRLQRNTFQLGTEMEYMY